MHAYNISIYLLGSGDRATSANQHGGATLGRLRVVTAPPTCVQDLAICTTPGRFLIMIIMSFSINFTAINLIEFNPNAFFQFLLSFYIYILYYILI